MKFILLGSSILLGVLVLLVGDGIFVILPQALGARQWGFILATLASLLALSLLHLKKDGRRGLWLFFLVYPFLAHSIFYLNLSSSFFIIAPTSLFLGLHVLLSKRHSLPLSLWLLLLFCASTLVSVFVAENRYTAAAFFVLAVGNFALSAYLMYAGIKEAKDPLRFVRGVVLAIAAGSVIYFVVETAAFQIRPTDILSIIMRRWYELPMGRAYTGGYREPAGLGFVYSLLLWIMWFFVQDRSTAQTRLARWIDGLGFLAILVFLFVAGTRSAVLNILAIFLVLLLLRRWLTVRNVLRIRLRYLAALGVVVGISAWLLIPRTILTTRSRTPPPWIEPTYVSIGPRTFRLVGTTADYYKRNLISVQDFVRHPLGSGPLNATPVKESTVGGLAFYYSFLTNLIVTGATFGWLSLLLWIVFVVYVIRRAFQLRAGGANEPLYALTVVFLAILLASLLPGSFYLGPTLNWATFHRALPLSPETPSLPGDYPAILSGILVGALAGLLERSRQSPKAGRAASDSQLDYAER